MPPERPTEDDGLDDEQRAKQQADVDMIAEGLFTLHGRIDSLTEEPDEEPTQEDRP